jgi:hypothetical protein
LTRSAIDTGTPLASIRIDVEAGLGSYDDSVPEGRKGLSD